MEVHLMWPLIFAVVFAAFMDRLVKKYFPDDGVSRIPKP